MSRTARRDTPGSDPFLGALETCEARPRGWDAGVKKGVEPERGRMQVAEGAVDVEDTAVPATAPTPAASIQLGVVVLCWNGVKAAPGPWVLKGPTPAVPLARPKVGRAPVAAASVPADPRRLNVTTSMLGLKMVT